jgi:hypothetical protein
MAGEIPQVSTPHGQSILMLCNTLAPFDVIYLARRKIPPSFGSIRKKSLKSS